MIGTGYVGLVTGTCFAEMGNTVYCVDNDEHKIEKLKNGIIPIFEPGLEDMVKRGQSKGNLIFTTDLKKALESTSICFIAVGTPMGEDGSADLKHVEAVAESIGTYIVRDMLVVNKSTVPVGTGERVENIIHRILQERKSEHKVSVISNPEFLKEGNAVEDCMQPDRIIIGAENEKDINIMKDLYEPFTVNSERFVVMDVHSAEMTKYAANAMLATRISFMNEIAGICERVGADISKVRKGIGSDHRIGYSFLYAGCGYGGSCFPKDVKALIKTARDMDYTAGILEKVEEVNEKQKLVLVNKVIKYFGDDLTGKDFALWGLAFKPDTDDMREAPAITIINELTKRGARIKAYDPKAIEEAKEFYLKDNTSVTYMDNKYDTLNDADALLLVTEWKEFRSPDFEEMSMRLKKKLIFDGRNQYSNRIIKEYGFEYYSIGRPKY